MLYDVNQGKLITALAAELKRQHVVVPPDWAAFAKTGHHREHAPVDEDWWYTRAASVLRTIYTRGPIGTEKLRVRYGGRKNRGVAPDRFYPAGGNHLRKILQQLEAAKLVEQAAKGVHKGRVITPLGRKLLHAVAGVVRAQKPAPKTEAKPTPKAPEAPKPEAKPEQKAETPKAAPEAPAEPAAKTEA
ncbi:30S ribosomal protein S19e [Candidatus Woesearchaeota archaeon]|nr:30S ribosomal protein S19e [Candidatus Woesearchaeota archaeon]